MVARLMAVVVARLLVVAMVVVVPRIMVVAVVLTV